MQSTSVVTVSAAVAGFPSAPSAQVQILDQVVAIVDDDIILASELQERIQGARITMEARGIEVPEEDILVRETLDRLILDGIQLQLATRYGVRIPDQQLDESMTRTLNKTVSLWSNSDWHLKNQDRALPQPARG